MHIDSDTNDRYSSETAKSTEDCPMADGIPVRLRFKKGKHSVPMEKIERDLFPILRRRTEVFSRNHGKPLRTTLMEATIDTGDAPPQWVPQRRLNPEQRKVVVDEIERMLKNGIIEPAMSPWQSAIVLIRRKDGKYRFCCDFTKVNKVSKVVAYNLPRIDDTLDSLGGGTYFSNCDVSTAYWTIPLKKEDKCKTAFASPIGNFQFTVMPFGYRNAPAIWQSFMAMVLSKTNFLCTVGFYDDQMLYSTSYEQHLKDIDTVLELLIDAGCTVKAEKCNFFFKKALFLGHCVSAQGISMNPEKVKVIKDTNPRNAKELKSFLQLCSYYRKFVRGFATISDALQKKCTERRWKPYTNEESKSLELLKTRMTSEPVLKYPD